MKLSSVLQVPELILRGAAWGVGSPQLSDSLGSMVMHRAQGMGGSMRWAVREGTQGSFNRHLGTTLMHWDVRPIGGAPWEHPGPGVEHGGEASVGRAAERPNSCPPPTLPSWPQMELRIQMLPLRAWGRGQGQDPTEASVQHFPSTCSEPGVSFDAGGPPWSLTG